MKLRMQQLLEALAAAANPGVMEFDFEGLKFLKKGRHGRRSLCGRTLESSHAARQTASAARSHDELGRSAARAGCPGVSAL